MSPTSGIYGELTPPPTTGEGSATAATPKSAVSRGPMDSEPTIITRAVTVAPTTSFSESACRILQGKVLQGDRLGHYELAEYIGGGGMGRVFRAYDPRLARNVAVKVLAPEQGSDAESRLRFQNEAQSAARLDHENIARVFYVGEERGLQFIVFEFIEGVNVRELVERRGPLPLAEAISYTVQVADALAHAAERGVVHRDIKPSNMLITGDGHLKLIDMGLARLRQVQPAGELTASGVTLGTFDYISPEQARDPRAADVRSDIYSLGCTLYFMLAGRPPFPGGTVLQKLLQHQADQPPDVRQLRPELPEDLSRVLRRMLAKDPRHRYPTPSALIDDLVALARNAGLQPVGNDHRRWGGAPRRELSALARHLPWVVALATLLLGIVALEAIWNFRSGNETRPNFIAAPPAAAAPDRGAASESPATSASEGARKPATAATNEAALSADVAPPRETNPRAAAASAPNPVGGR